MSAHDWKTMFDSEIWQAEDKGRWCGGCGLRVSDLATARALDTDCVKPKGRVLTVKGIKSFQGMEGHGFNASLYEDGKRLGLVIDEGNGGSYLYRFDYEKTRELQRWARVQEGGGGYDPLDMVLATLVGTYEETAKLKRWCKKKTVVKLADDPKDSYSIWKQAYTPEFAAHLREKHDVLEIVNERFLKGAKA